jgi:GAF domain-containing protein
MPALEAETRRTSRLTEIVKVGIDLTSLRRQGDVLNTLVKRVAEIMESATCTVMLINLEKKVAVVTAQIGLPPEATNKHIPLNFSFLRNLLENGEPLLVADIDREEPSIHEFLIRPDIRAFFAYPMMRGGHVIGMITLSSLEPYYPTPDEISACHLIAERAAAALENAILFEKTEHHLQQVQSLRMIDAAIASSFDLRAILNIIIYQILTQLSVDAADVLLLNPHSYALEYSVGKGFINNAIEKSASCWVKGL